ncbi:hypothetical protein ACWCXH_33860 [Kitasatospora sp. NPDC001660]
MTTNDAPASLRQQAEAKLRPMLDALGPLEEILKQRQDLIDALAKTDGPYGEAYAAAEAAGWSVQQLASMGASEPAVRPKRGRGRPRKSSSVPVQGTSAGAEAGAASPTVGGQSSSE